MSNKKREREEREDIGKRPFSSEGHRLVSMAWVQVPAYHLLAGQPWASYVFAVLSLG